MLILMVMAVVFNIYNTLKKADNFHSHNCFMSTLKYHRLVLIIFVFFLNLMAMTNYIYGNDLRVKKK